MKDLLAKIYDRLPTGINLRALLFTFLIPIGALVADLADLGDGLGQVFSTQGAIEARLEILIGEVDADKAGAFIFENGERQLVADVAQSGAMRITNSNRFVSLSLPPFDDLLATNRAGRCWLYQYPRDGINKNQLDDGMSRSGNRTIISCPIYSNQALKGTTGVGWGRYLSKQEIEQNSKTVQEAADDIAPML